MYANISCLHIHKLRKFKYHQVERFYGTYYLPEHGSLQTHVTTVHIIIFNIYELYGRLPNILPFTDIHRHLTQYTINYCTGLDTSTLCYIFYKF